MSNPGQHPSPWPCYLLRVFNILLSITFCLVSQNPFLLLVYKNADWVTYDYYQLGMTWLGSCPFKKISVYLDIDSRADATEAPPYIPGPPGFTSNYADRLHTPQEPASFFFARGLSPAPGSMLGPKQVQPRSAGRVNTPGDKHNQWREGKGQWVDAPVPRPSWEQFWGMSPTQILRWSPARLCAPGTHSENGSLSPALGFLISPQHCPLCSLESPPK